ncbi:MAG: ATP phosphoribosyltransferase regulatory subunit [Pseudomonadota bacterium]
MKTHWRLPRGVEEVLPPTAWALELLRRQVLDLFNTWGFEYVEPPVIEYLDALLVGSGEDLDLQTLKVVDQASGRQLGVRADMTSQAVRIDAHSRVTDGVQRLCYAGAVVFANPQIAQSSRVPFKAGAEIFGAPGLGADAEVIKLMLATLAVAGIDHPVLLVGHMGIYRGLVDVLLAQGDLQPQDEKRLFKCVQRKSEADIRALLRPSPLADIMATLPTRMCEVVDTSTLRQLRDELDGLPAAALAAYDELQQLVGLVDDDSCAVRVDVSELSGYGYHNGPVFAVYHPQHGSALAQGGRYDGVGEVFGRVRPATGFDVDLKNLIPVVDLPGPIFAPFVTEPGELAGLNETVQSLRQAGERVLCALSADEVAPPGGRQLARLGGQWQVVDAIADE